VVDYLAYQLAVFIYWIPYEWKLFSSAKMPKKIKSNDKEQLLPAIKAAGHGGYGSLTEFVQWAFVFKHLISVLQHSARIQSSLLRKRSRFLDW
jgi:hypothetical protein